MDSSAASCERLVAAAVEGVSAIDRCYPVLAAMALPGGDRCQVVSALLYASIDQARSACVLVANDPGQGMFAALILLRSQLDLLMRAAFFAGPASDDQLAHYLAEDEMPSHEGQRLGPKSLARINQAHFEWTPVDRVPNLVSGQWKTLCGMTHGGASLLRFYIHEDGVYPYPVSDEFLTAITNTVTLAHFGVSIALSLATNAREEQFQSDLQQWFKDGKAYFLKWAPLP